MPTSLTAAELGRRLASRQISAREAAEAHLARIARLDQSCGAFLEVTSERAFADADNAQAMLDRGEGGPLTGVPIALKDNLSTEGIRTTCASRILENYVAPYDATVASRLREQGLVLLGKTNLDEFAMGTSTENSAFQPTRNPWSADRSPGGSSGGSAAAVAAEMAPLALGSDTGGSIRQPASLCGVVGFKPTYGRVSRYGLVAFGSSLDQIGPFGRTVEDVALLAEAISGHDPRDSTSLTAPAIRASQLGDGSLRGKRAALPRELLGAEVAPGVRECVLNAIEALRAQGVAVDEVSLPSLAYGVTTYYIIAPAEASSNLARYDGIRYGPRAEGTSHTEAVSKTRGSLFGHEVKSRIMIGTYALSAGYYDAYYLRAQKVRALMTAQMDEALSDCDFIVTPTSPVTAFKIGELTSDPLAMKLLDYCTIPANLGGYPAISIPCGLSEGLPVGLHLIGQRMGDEELLKSAACIERVLDLGAFRPPLE